MPAIELNNISKKFGAKEVIRDINVSIEEGDFLVLLGPSGCGKSTLLRMLAGLESISGGEILIGGRRVDQLPPGERDIAFVFQSYALYPHLSVRRNMHVLPAVDAAVSLVAPPADHRRSGKTPDREIIKRR